MHSNAEFDDWRFGGSFEENIHNQPTIHHPATPSFWSEKYAGAVAQFLNKYQRTNGQDESILRALARLVLSTNWKKDNDTEVLNQLHLDEAKIRNISPWTLQEILTMQYTLYNLGISQQNLLEQRQIILDLLGEISLGNVSYHEIGKKVCGLSLCIFQVWILQQIDLNAALALQELITNLYGENLYKAKLQFVKDYEDENGDITHLFGELSKIQSRAEQEIQDFIADLPKTIIAKLIFMLIKLEFIGGSRQMIDEIKRMFSPVIGIRGTVT